MVFMTNKKYLIHNHFNLRSFMSQSVLYFSPIDAYNHDLKKYPKFSEARAISFEQGPGELLIIPPGWFHQVTNGSFVCFFFYQHWMNKCHLQTLLRGFIGI